MIAVAPHETGLQEINDSVQLSVISLFIKFAMYFPHKEKNELTRIILIKSGYNGKNIKI